MVIDVGLRAERQDGSDRRDMRYPFDSLGAQRHTHSPYLVHVPVPYFDLFDGCFGGSTHSTYLFDGGFPAWYHNPYT